MNTCPGCLVLKQSLPFWSRQYKVWSWQPNKTYSSLTVTPEKIAAPVSKVHSTLPSTTDIEQTLPLTVATTIKSSLRSAGELKTGADKLTLKTVLPSVRAKAAKIPLSVAQKTLWALGLSRTFVVMLAPETFLFQINCPEVFKQ